MPAPNTFCPRARAMRVLGDEGMARVMDNLEPGGSGIAADGLTKEQADVLAEATSMGFPPRAWFCTPFMGDGSLMVLAPYVYAIYPQYFTEFWTKEGFAGADPDSSEAKARVRFVTTVKELISRKKEKGGEFTSVDNSWINTMVGNVETPLIRMSEQPPEGSYLFHCRIRVLDGAAAGKECSIETIEDGIVTVSSAFDGGNSQDALAGLAVGDRIMIDNSDYLAMQTLHRHQVPDSSFKVYDQFKDPEGKPLYPQLPMLIAPEIARNGGGSIQSGDIHGKMIAVCSLLDESASPWHGDWYLRKVEGCLGDQTADHFRLYYNDNCIHDDRAGYLDDPWHQVDYLGILHQALLDVADWCEKGVAPAPNTSYQYEDGQIIVPENADKRHGLQPVVHALANGEKCVTVSVGEAVTFTAQIEVPAGTGRVTAAAWDYEKTGDFTREEKLNLSENGEQATVTTAHSFSKPGVYFPVIKVKSNRKGTLEDIFTQCKNLDRVRVIVKG
ncbi:MAG: PKD domain-containing protein, partial [Lachnospiraceae bacterium]|nr:PKD domain-containing protein [Lachnospiraceae bacterium]